MDDHDPLDTKFLTVVVIAFIGLFAFAYVMFPRHDAEATPAPAVSGSGPAASAAQKK